MSDTIGLAPCPAPPWTIKRFSPTWKLLSSTISCQDRGRVKLESNSKSIENGLLFTVICSRVLPGPETLNIRITVRSRSKSGKSNVKSRPVASKGVSEARSATNCANSGIWSSFLTGRRCHEASRVERVDSVGILWTVAASRVSGSRPSDDVVAVAADQRDKSRIPLPTTQELS